MSNHSTSSATELTTAASFPDHHEQRQQFFSFWGAVLSNAAMLCKFMIIRVQVQFVVKAQDDSLTPSICGSEESL